MPTSVLKTLALADYYNVIIRIYLTSVLYRSLQKVQGHRTTQGHRAGVDVDVTPPTGGPVGHLPPIQRPCVTAVRREVNRDTQGHLQNTQT